MGRPCRAKQTSYPHKGRGGKARIEPAHVLRGAGTHFTTSCHVPLASSTRVVLLKRRVSNKLCKTINPWGAQGERFPGTRGTRVGIPGNCDAKEKGNGVGILPILKIGEQRQNG
eukprot:1416603-Rhodomonas_salina.1